MASWISGSSLNNSADFTSPERTPNFNNQQPLREDSFESSVLRMSLEGANRLASVEGLEPLPGKTNYFIGNDPKRWRTGVPSYAKVGYHDIYPGIDLVYYGTSQHQLEYDFVLAPGADPKAIKFTDFHKASDGDWKLCESATLTPLASTAAKPVATAKE